MGLRLWYCEISQVIAEYTDAQSAPLHVASYWVKTSYIVGAAIGRPQFTADCL